MKAEVKKEITLNLKLTKDEVDWLKYIMQNPICIPSKPGKEPIESKRDKYYRELFWNAMNTFEV